MADAVRVSVTVNGQKQSAEVEPRLLLVHFLRDTLGLTGTHVGCDTSNCGACTVHFDGESVKSCTLLAVQADGAEVRTIEGMASGTDLHPLQEGFYAEHGLQCGYCTPGMIMAAADLLERNPDPSERRDPPRAGRQPVPLHGLSQHRQGGPARRAAPAARRGARAGDVRGRAARPRRSSRRRGWAHERRQRSAATACTSAARMRRKEDPPLIQGRGNYVDDISLPGALHAAFVRSPEAHARIASIDTSAALAREGVQAVYTGNDVDLESGLPLAWVPPGIEVQAPEHWPLAKDVVRHVGDPVAIVIGTDKYAVVDAAEDVIVEYDPLPVVTDPEAALAGGDLVHPDLGTNKVHEWSLGGDVESALEAADVVIERRFVNHRTAGAPIEPRGVVADYRAGELTLWSATQIPNFLRLFLALMLGMTEDRIRVIAPDVGGALRLEAADLRRGDPARLVLAQARPPGQVDRDALGEHDGRAPRPRPDRVREAGREPRRHVRGPAREDHRRPRRLLAVPRRR